MPDEGSPDPLSGGLAKSFTNTLTTVMNQTISEDRVAQGEMVEDSKIPVCGEIKDPNIKVTLQNKEIWDKFHACGTEMIITKAGRYAIVFFIEILNFPLVIGDSRMILDALTIS